ncbi:HNH endonuclease [Novosphingobium sp. HII-3]|uniref:HNH endonuclease n=1 Tax=Novosphingobium sp. HII-3 TaxID=2075565 RepID=UPI000CDB5281|nr:HNH endonuclease [Novosphingobium sp. HII-3]
MAKLKALGGRLSTLKPGLGALPPVERSESAQRNVYSPWRKWYNTARWKALRLAIFARDMFTCQWPGCGRLEGNTSQLVADHRTPHRGDEALFWDESNLWTLCKPCHDRLKQREERGAFR